LFIGHASCVRFRPSCAAPPLRAGRSTGLRSSHSLVSTGAHGLLDAPPVPEEKLRERAETGLRPSRYHHHRERGPGDLTRTRGSWGGTALDETRRRAWLGRSAVLSALVPVVAAAGCQPAGSAAAKAAPKPAAPAKVEGAPKEADLAT